MFNIKKRLWNFYYNVYYRKVGSDVCCCGSSDCSGDMSHGYVNAKEYAIK